MRNHKHYGTPQDTSFIGDIVRFIAEHGGLKDWEKDLLINRITVPTAGLDSPEVLRAMEGTSEAATQQPSEVPDPNQAHDAPPHAPCPLSIVQEANRTFAVVIGDRKWPIANCGTIGHTIAEGEEFHNALLPLGSVSHPGFPAPFRIPTDDEIRKAKNTADKNVERLMRLVEEYEKAITLRRGVGKTLGQVAYEAFHSVHKPTGWRVNPWDQMDVFEQNKWEIAGESCFLSIGTSPDEVAQDIQTIAARERFILLSEKYAYPDLARKQERAAFINSVAGFPRAPETT